MEVTRQKKQSKVMKELFYRLEPWINSKADTDFGKPPPKNRKSSFYGNQKEDVRKQKQQEF